MADDDNPVVQQRRLRSELRRLREDAHFVQKDVADTLEWSVSKVIRIETGAVGITKTDLIAMLHHYGVKDQKRIDELAEVARISRQSAWWDKYREQFGAQFITFLGYEASAKVHRQYHGQLVPGLLQTREYAHALMTSYGAKPEAVGLGVQVRLERQQLLDHKNPAELFYILDEAVIRRWVGGPEVMRKQLERLKELNRRPNINIQIARFDLGAYAGLKGSFMIFELPYQEEDYAVLLDFPDRDVLIQNNPEEASSFVETFYELEAIASSKSDTEKIIDEVVASLPGSESTPKKKGAGGVPAES
jgi:transcriptional regulator with XRE-family HTH domain